MNIDLFSVIDCDGEELTFDGSVDITDSEFSAKATVTGKAVNFSGRVEVSANVGAEVSAVCARCLEKVVEMLKFKIEETVGDDDLILDGTVLDISSMVEKHIYMRMPMKVLCSEDCKGLCVHCGVNLNSESCSCDDDDIDERFALLQKLLDDQKDE